MKRSATEISIVGWSAMTGGGPTSDAHVLPHPEYDEAVPQLVAALVAVNAQPVFDWMRWGKSRPDAGGVGLAQAPDAMLLVTVVVRGEHFNDGTIAKEIEDGSLLAAAGRIVTALDKYQGEPGGKLPSWFTLARRISSRRTILRAPGLSQMRPVIDGLPGRPDVPMTTRFRRRRTCH